MRVICFEGCHGVGKSTVINNLKERGFQTLDEAFLDMPSYTSLAPQSLTMEMTWISLWFTRLLRIKEQCQDPESAIFFADRSPFSAIYYSKTDQTTRQHIEFIIRSQIEELKASAGIEITTVLLTVPPSTLWSRIQTRLGLEPERRKYNEHMRSWMEETYSWYEMFRWDYRLCTERKVDAVVESVHKILGCGMPPMYRILEIES
eukprot:gnl/Dysnectes_brevis/2296_a2702_1614.p1 GENE.gnl/Dysnectes_brevis/2296_a2702_1614~~gnl/Dysnectes_brevis/2296_a2702_1614.p1  ORF type:complete len:204 (-),score=44.04 gnl/Dysnectes_brevis/2296_a2702_1614:64-675(-)